MRRQAEHCPVARAADLLAEPGMLLVIRELLFGNRSTVELGRGIPGIPPAMLVNRLVALMNAGLVIRLPDDEGGVRYGLTDAGDELRPVLECLGQWGHRWLPAPPADELDLDLLIFDISRQIDRALLPVRPVSVHIDLVDGPRRWWLVLSKAGVVVQHSDPGVPTVAALECTMAALTDVWLGYLPWLDAISAGHIRITGDRDAVLHVAGWIGVSRFALGPA